jgi:hypothetical protein
MINKQSVAGLRMDYVVVEPSRRLPRATEDQLPISIHVAIFPRSFKLRRYRLISFSIYQISPRSGLTNGGNSSTDFDPIELPRYDINEILKSSSAGRICKAKHFSSHTTAVGRMP